MGCWEAVRNHAAAVEPGHCRVVTVTGSRPDLRGEVPAGLEKPLQVRLFSLLDGFFRVTGGRIRRIVNMKFWDSTLQLHFFFRQTFKRHKRFKHNGFSSGFDTTTSVTFVKSEQSGLNQLKQKILAT